MEQVIYLTDGNECRVKRLGIFELDQIKPAISGPFTYKMKTLTGQEYDVEFDLASYPAPPVKPDIPEGGLVENTGPWFEYLDWQRYQAAESYQQQKKRSLEAYYREVISYILKHCVQEADVLRIVGEEDWRRIYEAALVPQLSLDDLRKALEHTYNAMYDGEPLFEAMQKIPEGSATYNTLRNLETKLMVEMNMTEEVYASMPVEERARKVCSLFIGDIVSYLDYLKESKNRGKSNNKDGER